MMRRCPCCGVNTRKSDVVCHLCGHVEGAVTLLRW